MLFIEQSLLFDLLKAFDEIESSNIQIFFLFSFMLAQHVL